MNISDNITISVVDNSGQAYQFDANISDINGSFMVLKLYDEDTHLEKGPFKPVDNSQDELGHFDYLSLYIERFLLYRDNSQGIDMSNKMAQDDIKLIKEAVNNYES